VTVGRLGSLATIRRQVFVFALIGLVTTALQYVILAVSVEWLNQNPVPSSAVGFVVSALLSYALNHRFTFGGTASHKFALPRFFLVAATGLTLNTTLIWIGYSLFNLHYLLAQLLATAFVFIWNFAGNRWWSFR
jgi:putative flippase GtrA